MSTPVISLSVIVTYRLFLSRLSVALSLLVCSITGSAAENSTPISFFRATQNRATYLRNPAQYKRFVADGRTGKTEYYVETKPEYVIPKKAIESVIVKDAENYAATDEPYRETKSHFPHKERRPIPKYYEITFKISSPEGRKFSQFTEKNKQGFFETIVGEQSIGVQEFDLPFEPDRSGSLEFKVYFRASDSDDRRLQNLLLPFQDLVVWKKQP